MIDITDSTTLDARTVTMTKTHPTDAKFWPRAYASLVDGAILSTIVFIYMFVIKSLLDYYQYYFFDFFTSNQFDSKISVQLNILASTAISGLILSFFAGFIYYCYYLTSTEQATPGMKIHGLKLVNIQGDPVSLGQIFLREIISFISFWGFFIGYLMILFTKRRQALHDMVALTYVQDISQSSSAEILIAQQHQIYTYGGFWRRLGAMIIDNILCIGFSFLCVSIAFENYYNNSEDFFQNIFFTKNNDAYSIIINLLLYMVTFIYWIFFTSSKFQATPGKMLFSLKIVDNHGNQLTPLRSFVRYCSYNYSLIILGIGFIMIAFTKRKQGLHDKIASTYVIHVPKKVKDKIIKSDSLL